MGLARATQLTGLASLQIEAWVSESLQAAALTLAPSLGRLFVQRLRSYTGYLKETSLSREKKQGLIYHTSPKPKSENDFYTPLFKNSVLKLRRRYCICEISVRGRQFILLGMKFGWSTEEVHSGGHVQNRTRPYASLSLSFLNTALKEIWIRRSSRMHELKNWERLENWWSGLMLKSASSLYLPA